MLDAPEDSCDVGCFRFVGAPDLLYGDHPHFWLKNGDVHRTGYLDIWGYGRAGRRIVPDPTGDIPSGPAGVESSNRKRKRRTNKPWACRRSLWIGMRKQRVA